MAYRRYLIVEHKSDDSGCPLPVHHLLRGYHWQRLDDTHVLAFAELGAENIPDLDAHDKCHLLPSHVSNKRIHHHARSRNEHHHAEHLRKIGIEDDHTMSDLIDVVSDTMASVMHHDS